MGSPMAETTIPVVRNVHNSIKALEEVSRLFASLLAIVVGTGDSK